MILRPASSADFAAILQLNAASVHFLSPLDPARLQHLDAQAALHLVVERNARVEAFLLAFAPGADYDSPNYRWFVERYADFLYIDRVVVSAAVRAAGLGAALYAAAGDFAAAKKLGRLVCEYDLDPPNPASERFHSRQGFVEQGRQWLYGGSKQVSLQVRELAPF